MNSIGINSIGGQKWSPFFCSLFLFRLNINKHFINKKFFSLIKLPYICHVDNFPQRQILTNN